MAAKTLSPNGRKLLTQLEGSRLKAYKDGAGVWTIAVGVTRYPDGRAVRQGDIITQAQADEYTTYAVSLFERVVNKVITRDLTQNQFDALVIFVYNIGGTAFIAGTVDEKINAGNMIDAVQTWSKYNKVRNAVTGKLEADNGLDNRRRAEINLFTKK